MRKPKTIAISAAITTKDFLDMGILQKAQENIIFV
jgi:hypothetical protein